MSSETKKRKIEHIGIVLEKDVEPTESPFDKYELPYKALPNLDFSKIDTSVDFFGKKLSFPFIISSMTGGAKKASVINQNLAIAAQETGVALGLGSMRIVIEDPSSAKSFDVRKLCPDVPLFANLGLVQLNYGFGADEINRIIDSVQADGIFLHINPLQEVIQPEGNTNFEGLVDKLGEILPEINAPVIVKEVGVGIDVESAKRLREVGIEWIDVSGTGGTSWAVVEGYRGDASLGRLFGRVGTSTDYLLSECKGIEGLNLIAGGGVRNGLDIAKGLMLDAQLATAAAPLLAPALESSKKCIEILKGWEDQLKVAMFCVGAGDVSGLQSKSLKKK